jgi:hypothetical protein
MLAPGEGEWKCGSIVLEHGKDRQTSALGIEEMRLHPDTPRCFCTKSSQSVENKVPALQKAPKSSEDAENNTDNVEATRI